MQIFSLQTTCMVGHVFVLSLCFEKKKESVTLVISY